MQHESSRVADQPSFAWPASLSQAAAAVHRLALAIARRTEPAARQRGRFALALQGGGALGAFTWGVLDRLLELEEFHPDALSGASAGAANAVVLASGWLRAGRDGAKEALDHFWSRVGALPSLWRSPPGALFDPGVALEMASSLVSPYDFNPLNHNPLRAILSELADFERLRRAEAPPIFISATDVETGRARIFSPAELSLDAVLASACLPHLFQAVEIDGHSYWDGGYTSNPPIAPLRRFLTRARLLLVLVNPSQRRGLPRAAHDIAARLHQIRANASVWPEIADDSRVETIELAEDKSGSLAAAKYNNDWRVIQTLRDRGRAAADAWLGPALAPLPGNL